MKRAFFCLGMALTLAFVLSSDALAGQFKRIRAIPNGGEVSSYASPKNFGNAMEMDVYEFESTTVTDSYRCRLLSNSTGRALRLRLIGVDGSIIASCTTAVNGVCSLPSFSLLPNLLFQCTVASGNPFPVTSSALYRIGIGRP